MTRPTETPEGFELPPRNAPRAFHSWELIDDTALARDLRARRLRIDRWCYFVAMSVLLSIHLRALWAIAARNWDWIFP